MNKFLSALFTKCRPFNDPPLFYLIAILLFAAIIATGISTGEVSLKLTNPVPLDSTTGYIYLGVQFSFLLIAAFLFIYKMRNNLSEGT